MGIRMQKQLAAGSKCAAQPRMAGKFAEGGRVKSPATGPRGAKDCACGMKCGGKVGKKK